MTEPLQLAVPAPDEVHVWWIDLSATRDEAGSTLSSDERARAARFRRLHDRERWLRARVAVRHILAGYLRLPPHDVRFASTAIQEPPFLPARVTMVEGERGARAFSAKPALANDPRLRFNLTHAGDRAALAVTWEREVGIDLEPIDADLDLPRLLTSACTPAEITRVGALPPGQRTEAFLTRWTVKEAYLKAIGVGMAREPRSLEVEFLEDGRTIIHDAREEDSSARWDVRLLDAGPGWVAALAVAGFASTPVEFTWPSRR